MILSEKDPLDYIKKALERIPDNYPQNDYQSIAYYREKFIENGAVINKEEAVFKTYYPEAGDSTKNQHQLLLYKPEENPQQFQFMREWFEAKQERKKDRLDYRRKLTLARVNSNRFTDYYWWRRRNSLFIR